MVSSYLGECGHVQYISVGNEETQLANLEPRQQGTSQNLGYAVIVKAVRRPKIKKRYRGKFGCEPPRYNAEMARSEHDAALAGGMPRLWKLLLEGRFQLMLTSVPACGRWSICLYKTSDIVYSQLPALYGGFGRERKERKKGNVNANNLCHVSQAVGW